jgi:hypothetical protein
MLSPERRWARRVWRGIVACFAAVLVIMVAAFDSDIRELLGPIGTLVPLWHDINAWWVAVPVLIALLQRVYRVTDSLGQFVDDPRSKAAHGAVAEVRDQLKRVIGQATGRRRRLVIIVDDLERCDPAKSVDVCEVATQLLGHDDVVTILIADMDVVADAAAAKYPDSTGATAARARRAAGGGELSWGEQYLHKLVQLRFNLPALGPTDVQRMLGYTGPYQSKAVEDRG